MIVYIFRIDNLENKPQPPAIQGGSCRFYREPSVAKNAVHPPMIECPEVLGNGASAVFRGGRGALFRATSHQQASGEWFRLGQDGASACGFEATVPIAAVLPGNYEPVKVVADALDRLRGGIRARHPDPCERGQRRLPLPVLRRDAPVGFPPAAGEIDQRLRRQVRAGPRSGAAGFSGAKRPICRRT